MARQLNGDADIPTDLIQVRDSENLSEIDFIDCMIGIKQGRIYNNPKGSNNIAEDFFIYTHGLVKKNKLIDDQELKGKQEIGMKQFEFRDEFKGDGKYEIRNDVLPYRTIDVIFNKKNIFLNMQNPNPAGIIYDIYNREKWFPLLKIRDKNVTDVKDLKVWKQDIPAFYSFKNFSPYFSEEEIDGMKKRIVSCVSNTIRVIRNQKNLNSNFKPVNF